MVDIHSHFLFGIDDGSKNQSQTIDMLHQANSVGITDLVATPHVNETTNEKYLKQVNENFNEVKRIINNEGLNLKIPGLRKLYWIQKPLTGLIFLNC